VSGFGSGTPGTVTANQGTAGLITAPWPVKLSDGTAAVGTAANPLRTSGTIADGANLDAFSRQRVSDPKTLFSVQCQYDAEPLKMEGFASGTGVAPAHDANTRMVTISCTAGTGVSAFQSYAYLPYQPGKSQLIFITGCLRAATASVVKEFGYFDSLNGIIYRQSGAGVLSMVRRKNTTGSVLEEEVVQADWNLDKLNGAGGTANPSGITLVQANVFILVIDLQFLGMGRVRVGFDIGGVIVYVHEFKHANVLTVPYMQQASLPVQALMTSSASGSTATMDFKCAAVTSEGGFEADGELRFATPEGTVTAGSGTRTHILSLRPKTTFNSKANRSYFKLLDVDLLADAKPVRWELCIGSTFSVAPTWADVNSTYSGYEIGTAGTLTAAGLVIDSGFLASSNSTRGAMENQLTQGYPISLDRAGAVRALGTLSLIVTGIGGTSDCRASFCFSVTR
jgi:hypothetical protein